PGASRSARGANPAALGRSGGASHRRCAGDSTRCAGLRRRCALDHRRRSLTVVARRVPLLDLQAQHRQIRDEVLKEVVRVVDSQRFILGEDVRKLEDELAAYCSSRYAIGCASGSDALVLALMALDIKPGDEVLTTPYSFFATAGSVSRI